MLSIFNLNEFAWSNSSVTSHAAATRIFNTCNYPIIQPPYLHLLLNIHIDLDF